MTATPSLPVARYEFHAQVRDGGSPDDPLGGATALRHLREKVRPAALSGPARAADAPARGVRPQLIGERCAEGAGVKNVAG